MHALLTSTTEHVAQHVCIRTWAVYGLHTTLTCSGHLTSGKKARGGEARPALLATLLLWGLSRRHRGAAIQACRQVKSKEG
jgi:hypothetical protein